MSDFSSQDRENPENSLFSGFWFSTTILIEKERPVVFFRLPWCISHFRDAFLENRGAFSRSVVVVR